MCFLNLSWLYLLTSGTSLHPAIQAFLRVHAHAWQIDREHLDLGSPTQTQKGKRGSTKNQCPACPVCHEQGTLDSTGQVCVLEQRWSRHSCSHYRVEKKQIIQNKRGQRMTKVRTLDTFSCFSCKSLKTGSKNSALLAALTMSKSAFRLHIRIYLSELLLKCRCC